MAKKIYLVRHGETNNNVKNLVQSPESELSQIGIKQAELLSQRLSRIKFDCLIVSDYIRARQTIEPFLSLASVVPFYTDLVREVRSPSKFYNVYNRSDDFVNFLQTADANIDNSAWHYSDEENFHDVIARVIKLVNKLEQIPGDVVVVSHSLFIIHIILYIISNRTLDVDMWRKLRYGFSSNNTGISVLQFSEEYNIWKLLTFNDHAHFAE